MYLCNIIIMSQIDHSKRLRTKLIKFEDKLDEFSRQLKIIYSSTKTKCTILFQFDIPKMIIF